TLAETRALDQARDMYQLSADADPDNISGNFKAGNAFLQTVGKDRAAKYFERVLAADPEYRFNILYLIGRSYQYGLDFDKALDYYNRYRTNLTQNEGYRGNDKTSLAEVDRRIYESRNGKEFVANPAHYAVVNVGSAINSESREYGPVINEDETLMVFTSRRQDGNLNENVADDNVPYEDIFISHKKDGKWQYAQNIGDIVNSEYHDSNLALSAAGDQLFLYSDENNGDIYTSKKLADDTWTTPEPLNDNINSSYAEKSVSLSSDGSMLFFSSNRPSHVGDVENTDIYYCTKDKNGEWARPKSLGEEINTEFDEDAPFIDYDGVTLYFSSNGRKGMGGFDIFRSVYDSIEGVWGAPQNIGYPINTPDDDIYFVSTKDGQRGYYASVREDGMGYTDIYMVTILKDGEDVNQVGSKEVEPPKVEEPITDIEIEKVDIQEVKPKEPELSLQPVILTVNVLDASTEVPMDAKISLRTAGDNRIVGSKRASMGVYTFTINNTASTEYMLSVEYTGYVFSNTKLNIEAVAGVAPKQMSRTINLKKVQKSVGVSKVLRNIYFKFNKATFTTDSYTELNKLEKMLSDNASIIVEISGHTDAIGNDNYNKKLSQLRAEAVVRYLIEKGIDQRRLTAVGHGEEKPLASNDDENEGREINRRVEFKILNN
ncbi:MAG: OmpA family protein, partial [Cyclobacteriaceae bacterium]|nr:OmpA family protein [Cyclobacteriaceae bacterium]